MTVPTGKTRLDHIDALRGVAALLVVFQHASETIVRILGETGPVTHILHLLTFEAFNLGKFGVVTFFAISGFVIPFSFKGEHPVRRFLVSRFFRLYPAYWVSLIIAVPVGLAIGVTYTPVQVLANVTMIQTVFRQPDVLGVYWTLFIEMLFYGLCVFTFTIGRMRSAGNLLLVMSAFLAVSLAAAVINYRTAMELPIALPLSLAVMHFGALARLLLVEREDSARRWFPVGLIVILALLLPICFLGYAKDAAHGGFIPYATSYYVALGTFLACVFGRLFVSPATLFLGKISYAVYLFHAILVLVALPAGLAVPTAWVIPTVFALMLCSIPISWAVFVWIERPAISLGHRLANRISHPAAKT